MNSKPILLEAAKFLILAILAWLFYVLPEFIITLVVIGPIRIFSGGIYFKKYIFNFIFTAVFFTLAILLGKTVSLPFYLQDVIISICVLASYFIGPVISFDKRLIFKRQYAYYRLVTVVLILIPFISLCFLGNFPFRNCMFWIVIIQTVQLFIARLIRNDKLYHEPACSSSN